jgi:hypothetical protein
MMPRMRFVPVALLCTLCACGVLEQSVEDQMPIFSPKGGDIRNPGPTVHSAAPVDPSNPIAQGGASGLLNSNNNTNNNAPVTSPSLSGSNNTNNNPPVSSPSISGGTNANNNPPTAGESILGGRPGNVAARTGQSGSTNITRGATPTTETAEIVVSRRGREGRFELVMFLQSDTWHFQRRVDNKDGTDSWFFIRRKMNDRGIEDILFDRRTIERPRDGAPEPTRSPR